MPIGTLMLLAFRARFLGAIDTGMEALQLSYDVTSHTERVRRAYQSKTSFAAAITELEHASRHVKQLPQWQMWRAEAKQGENSATERLEELGE